MLTFFEDWTLFITVLVALVGLFFNVILRYGFSYSLAWSEELVREVILYTTFIGCSVAIKTRTVIGTPSCNWYPCSSLRSPCSATSGEPGVCCMMIFYGCQMCAMQVESNQSNHDPADPDRLSLRHPAPDGRPDDPTPAHRDARNMSSGNNVTQSSESDQLSRQKEMPVMETS